MWPPGLASKATNKVMQQDSPVTSATVRAIAAQNRRNIPQREPDDDILWRACSSLLEKFKMQMLKLHLNVVVEEPSIGAERAYLVATHTRQLPNAVAAAALAREQLCRRHEH